MIFTSSSFAHLSSRWDDGSASICCRNRTTVGRACKVYATHGEGFRGWSCSCPVDYLSLSLRQGVKGLVILTRRTSWRHKCERSAWKAVRQNWLGMLRGSYHSESRRYPKVHLRLAPQRLATRKGESLRDHAMISTREAVEYPDSHMESSINCSPPP